MTSSSSSAANTKPAIPQSPFFRPSKPKLVTVTQSVTTPRGTHTHILSQTQLLQTAHSQRGREDGSTPHATPVSSTNHYTSSSTSVTSSFDVLEAKSSLLGTYANLVNAVVGAGIVGIPYALNQTGLLTGVLLIILVAVLTDKSLRLLIDTGKLLHVPSYELLMEALFGKAGFIFISLSMFVMSYGGMICYLLIIKDTLPTLLPFLWARASTADSTSTSFNTSSHLELEAGAVEWVKQMVLIASSLLVILPLSLQRDMAHLSKTSSLSVLFDILLVGIVVIFSPVQESIQANGGLKQVLLDSTIHPSTLFTGLGVLSFAFVCQDSSFIIAGSLHRPTKSRWKSVSRWAMITCTLLAIVMGVSGYLAFQSSTDGNILNNFSSTSYLTLSPITYASTSPTSTSTNIQDGRHTRHLSTYPDPSTTKTLVSSDSSSHIVATTKIGTAPKSSNHGKTSSSPNSTTTPAPALLPSQQWAANIARFLLGTTMFFVYPLASFVCRHVLIVLFFQGPIARQGNDHTVLKRADRRIALTVFLYLAALLPALFCDSVGTILAITGAIGGSCLSYVGPGVAYLGAHGQEFLEMVRQRWIKELHIGSPLEIEDDVEKCVKANEKYSVLWMFPAPSSPSTSQSRSNNRTTNRGEDTPLLSRECSKDSLDIPSNPSTSVAHSRVLLFENEGSVNSWDIFIWYTCCMPLWCTIASIGSRNSQAFIQTQRDQRQEKVVKSKTPKNKTVLHIKPQLTLDSSNPLSLAQMNHVGPLSSREVLEDRVSPTRILKHTHSDPVLDTTRRNHALNVTITVGDQVLLVPYPSLTTVRAFVDVSYGSDEHSNMMDRRISSSIHNYNKNGISSTTGHSEYQQSHSTSTQEQEDNLELPSPILGSHVNNVIIQEDIMTAVDENEEDTDNDESERCEVNPTWSDFLLSISYIVLGVVTATAGIFHLIGID